MADVRNERGFWEAAQRCNPSARPDFDSVILDVMSGLYGSNSICEKVSSDPRIVRLRDEAKVRQEKQEASRKSRRWFAGVFGPPALNVAR